MSDIPPELIFKDILCRLPVKSLLRFRCVSKSWRSLIDGKDFIKLHLHHSSKTNSSRTLLVDSKQSTQLHYVDLDSLERLDIGNTLERLDIGNTGFGSSSVADFCDGLVLVLLKPGNNFLWNPATRKTNKLPTPPPPPPSVSLGASEVNYVRDRYALGYDYKSDDYKVVSVVQASAWIGTPPLSSDTMVYSLKANSWKRVDNFPYALRDGKGWGFYLNGALHTLAKCGHNSEEVIMAFDLGKEEHCEVPMPAEFSGVVRGLVSLEVMGGFLTAVVPGKMKNSIELWVMREYRVKESWIKLFVVEQCNKLCPLAYSKSGDEVLLNCDSKYLNWYSLRNKSVTIARVNGLSASFDTIDPFRAKVIAWSLVSPLSPAGVATEKHKGKEIKKKRWSPTWQSSDHLLCSSIYHH